MRARLICCLVVVLACAASAQERRPAPAPAAAAAAPLPAPTPAEAATIAEVLAFEKEMEAAVVRGDAAFLDRVCARDFRFTHGDGWTTGGPPIKVDTKETWLEYLRQQPPPYVYRNLKSVQVELHGDIAITYGKYEYKPRSNKPNPSPGHLFVWFERVYAKRNGQWQYLSHRTVHGPGREDDQATSGGR
jgi:hypothetical protein